MPREDQHAQKAQYTETFSSSIEQTNGTREEWAVISAFYAALHYVQAYLSRFGAGDCDNHFKRFEEIARDPKLNIILAEYKYLYKLSHLARYKCTGLPVNPYREAKARLDAVKKQVEHARAN